MAYKRLGLLEFEETLLIILAFLKSVESLEHPKLRYSEEGWAHVPSRHGSFGVADMYVQRSPSFVSESRAYSGFRMKNSCYQLTGIKFLLRVFNLTELQTTHL